jgi:DNA-binding response OmpR family regulator
MRCNGCKNALRGESNASQRKHASLANDGQKAEKPGVKMSAGTNSVSLVIIDDNPLNNEFVTTALRREGLKIFSACDPREGLALVFKHHPQIVIVDLALPGMNGFEVLDRISEFDAHIEAVVITAFHSSMSAEQVRKRNAADYLNKPVSLGVLRERVGGRIDAIIKRERTSAGDK